MKLRTRIAAGGVTLSLLAGCHPQTPQPVTGATPTPEQREMADGVSTLNYLASGG